MQHDPLVLAYLAGVVDSDGFISVHRATKTRRRGNAEWTSTYHSARLGVAGTRREPHDLAAAEFGGSVYRYVPKNPAHRAQFQWIAGGPTAAHAIEAVRPYLRIKTVQADLVLELQALVEAQLTEVKAVSKPPYRIPTAMILEREQLCLAVRALNMDRHAAGRRTPLFAEKQEVDLESPRLVTR